MDKSVSAEGKSTPGAAATGVAQPAPNPAGSAFPGSAAGAEPAGADDIRSAGATPVVGGAPLEPEPTPELAATLKNAGIEISEAEAGLLLRVFDLRFAADSDKLLPSEKPRLDVLARALAAAPAGRNFLVEGHAAATGKPQGELELSLARAKRIVDELVARGLSAGRFIYRGLGSTMPIASNEDEAGKSRNRRVEVTILD
jgi:outer membrane protein OmpA-like peptidoglycan-associated protein